MMAEVRGEYTKWMVGSKWQKGNRTSNLHQTGYSNRRPNQVPFHSRIGNWGYNSNKTYQTCFEEFWFQRLHVDQNLVNKGLLTVTVSKHNTGVLPSQLQSHPLQIAFGCSLLDKLAHLWFTTNHKCNTVENGGPNFFFIHCNVEKIFLHVCKWTREKWEIVIQNMQNLNQD